MVCTKTQDIYFVFVKMLCLGLQGLLKIHTTFINNNLDVPSRPCILFIKADYHQPTVTKWKFTVMQLLVNA